MTKTTLFNFKGHDVRTVKIDGEPWFVAMDVTNVLGIGEKSRGYAVARLSDDERTLYQIQKGFRSVSVISESGLYKLVMRSDKTEAKDFQNWVTKVVLPAIRKDGGYIHGEEHVVSGAMTVDELVFKAMELMKRKVDRLSALLLQSAAQLLH
jgi:prophage antirepressor-like protein